MTTTLPVGLGQTYCPALVRGIGGHGLEGSSFEQWPTEPLNADAWRVLSGLVTEHRIWSMLADAVARGRFPTTDEQADEVRRQDEEAVLSCLHLDRELVQLHRALAASGVDARFFKGATTAIGFYREPGLRTYSDIDLIVPPEQLGLLTTVLTAERATRMGTSPWSAFRLADGWEVDVHQTLRHGPFGATIPLPELFVARPTIRIADADIPTLPTSVLFLTACYNAMLPSDLRRLAPLRDVAEMLQSGHLDPADLVSRARRWECSIVMAAAIRTAVDFFELAPDTLLAPWARNYEPSRRERLWLRSYHDTSSRRVFKQIWYTTWAYPSWRDGARFVHGQLLHDGRDPALERVRHLWQRLDLRGIGLMRSRGSE